MAKKHPGFKSVAKKISSKEHVPVKEANAMLAAATRRNKHTSSNPRLRRVKS